MSGNNTNKGKKITHRSKRRKSELPEGYDPELSGGMPELLCFPVPSKFMGKVKENAKVIRNRLGAAQQSAATNVGRAARAVRENIPFHTGTGFFASSSSPKQGFFRVIRKARQLLYGFAANFVRFGMRFWTELGKQYYKAQTQQSTPTPSPESSQSAEQTSGEQTPDAQMVREAQKAQNLAIYEVVASNTINAIRHNIDNLLNTIIAKASQSDLNTAIQAAHQELENNRMDVENALAMAETDLASGTITAGAEENPYYDMAHTATQWAIALCDDDLLDESEFDAYRWKWMASHFADIILHGQSEESKKYFKDPLNPDQLIAVDYPEEVANKVTPLFMAFQTGASHQTINETLREVAQSFAITTDVSVIIPNYDYAEGKNQSQYKIAPSEVTAQFKELIQHVLQGMLNLERPMQNASMAVHGHEFDDQELNELAQVWQRDLGVVLQVPEIQQLTFNMAITMAVANHRAFELGARVPAKLKEDFTPAFWRETLGLLHRGFINLPAKIKQYQSEGHDIEFDSLTYERALKQGNIANFLSHIEKLSRTLGKDPNGNTTTFKYADVIEKLDLQKYNLGNHEELFADFLHSVLVATNRGQKRIDVTKNLGDKTLQTSLNTLAHDVVLGPLPSSPTSSPRARRGSKG